MSKNAHNSTDARLAAVETSLLALDGEFQEFKIGIKAIQDKLDARSSPNWYLIFSVIALLVLGYSSAVQPIRADVARNELRMAELASALGGIDKLVDGVRNDLTRESERVTTIKDGFETVQREGSPVTDKRLTLLEYQIKERAGK